MNIVRAIGTSIVLYACTFLAALLIGVILSKTAIEPGRTPIAMWLVGIVLAGGLSSIASIWYFRPARLTASPLSAALFGVVAVATGFVLDLAIVVLSGRSVGDFVRSFYGTPWFWITLGAVLVATSSTGLFLQIRNRNADNEKTSDADRGSL